MARGPELARQRKIRPKISGNIIVTVGPGHRLWNVCVDLLQKFTSDPCIRKLRKRQSAPIRRKTVYGIQGHTHSEIVMRRGTSPIERTEPQVSLILRCVRTLHTLKESRVQKHRVDRIFPHHYRD